MGGGARRGFFLLLPLVAAGLLPGSHQAPAPAKAQQQPSGIRTFTYRQGPLTVGPYQVRYTSKATKDIKAPDMDGYIVWMHARVVDASGQPIPVRRLMLHHIVYKDLGRYDGEKHDPVCGGRSESFYGNGEENETLHFPPGYGYPIHRGDRWQTGWMLMNHKNRVDRAYIEYTVRVDTVHKLTPVRPYWLRATGCPRPGRIDPIFDVPGGRRKGSRYSKSITWKMPESGRLIAASGHAHGGAQDLTIRQPRCGDRRLLTSKPLFGRPDHPYYHVLPVLHEPGPINMSWDQTKTGIPVGKGERLKLTSNYDDHLVHTRVMAIMHLYVAPDRSARSSCAPLPKDLDNQRLNYKGRTRAPAIKVPLTGLDKYGHAHRISRPPGHRKRYAGNAIVLVRGKGFVKPNLSVPVGARVRWLFRDKASHNVTLANGPRGFSSQNKHRGHTYSERLRRPGTYRLFCSLHPVQMTETIVVRRRHRR